MEEKNVSNEERKEKDIELAEDIKKIKLQLANQSDKILINLKGLNILSEQQNRFISETEYSLGIIIPELKEVRAVTTEYSKRVEDLESNNESMFGIIEGNFNKSINDQKTQLEDKIKATSRNQKKRIKKIKAGLNNLKKSSEAELKSESNEALLKVFNENFKSLKNEMAGMINEFKTEIRTEFTEIKFEIGGIKNEVSDIKSEVADIKSEVA
ncbi:hypothetical protein SteCoe_4704 [Stentor coeruleus]|uniref:Uncharacterized protein n=1 Tax=Stentor coeruleus TaxID=5963 RepID=A0A1R2CU79_9CILI|nr:hypothetical protein SteCoe_4704 [Stentor coeruleus]